MNRYIEVTENVMIVFNEVLQERFPGFVNIKFKLLFDTKKRMKKGKLVLATTELVNEKVKMLSADDYAPEGYDYLIIIDSVVWEYAQEDDKKRLISHELNHVFIDEKGRYKILDHDIEDFFVEIERNVDKPNWASDLAFTAETIYGQENN